MIPHHVPGGEAGNYNELWVWVTAVFEELGQIVFGQTFLAYFVVLVLLIGGAKFVWRFVRGIL